MLSTLVHKQSPFVNNDVQRRVADGALVHRQDQFVNNVERRAADGDLNLGKELENNVGQKCYSMFVKNGRLEWWMTSFKTSFRALISIYKYP